MIDTKPALCVIYSLLSNLENMPEYRINGIIFDVIFMMSTCLKTILLSTFAILLMASCGSVQLVPVTYSEERPEETIAVISDPDMDIYLEHLSRKPNQLVFDLEVINHGLESISFNPEEIRIYGAFEPFPQADERPVPQAIVHSPDQGVKRMSEKEVNAYFKRKIRSQEAAQLALMVVGIALAVNDAIQDVNDSRKEFWTSQDFMRAQRRDAATFTGLVAADIAGGIIESGKFKTLEDLKYLPDEFFQGGLIFPESRVRGKVFFNYRENYSYYRIIIPYGGAHYIFDFREADGNERRVLRKLNL